MGKQHGKHCHITGVNYVIVFCTKNEEINNGHSNLRSYYGSKLSIKLLMMLILFVFFLIIWMYLLCPKTL